MNETKIAHISDVHLPLEGSNIPVISLFNKRIFSLLSWKFNRKYHHKPEIAHKIMEDLLSHQPNIVAITGDLTNLSLPDEFKRAADWLNYYLSGCKVHLIPGNHDALVPIDWNKAQGQWSQWGANYSKDFPFLLKYNSIALIGLNTAIPTAPFSAAGTIGNDQLRALNNLLSELSHKGCYRIVTLHHPPIDNVVSRRKGLRDIEQLLSVLTKNGAELILYGHTHKNRFDRLTNWEIPALGVSSASAQSTNPDRMASWNEIIISSSHGQWITKIISHRLSATGEIVTTPFYKVEHNRLYKRLPLA